MKYKIKKSASAPAISVNQLAEYRKCYLGISVSNPFFREQHLGLLLKWISNHFDDCTIIIGDYLHRINEEILHGKTGDEAIASSIILGDQIESTLEVALSILPQDRFKVYRWKEFLEKHPKVFIEKEKLNSIFNTNKLFQNNIIESCTEFIERLITRGEHLFLTKKEAISQSREYLIEEMAVFSVLIEQDFKVQVYPGTQLKILKDLANKKIPDVNTNLTEGIYVDLIVKKFK